MASSSSRSSSFSKNKASQVQKTYNTYKANKKFKSQMNQAEKNQPIYRDAYNGYKAAIANQLENGGFEFDAAGNQVYQDYSDDYRIMGNVAAEASAENIEELSGGYGTTYSGIVADQGLQGFLANEKNIIPSLYRQEKQNAMQDEANTINKGNLYNAMSAQDLEQYQSKLALWNNNREYAYNKFLNDYLQSAKEHQITKGKETSSESTSSTTTTVSAGRGSSSGKKKTLPMKSTDSKENAEAYLINQGYGKYANNILSRQDYVTTRVRADRNYDAGYAEYDKNGKLVKSNEPNVDRDYRAYLASYIRQAMKGKK